MVGQVMLLGSPSTVKKPEKQRVCALREAVGPQIPASLRPQPSLPGPTCYLKTEPNLRTVAADVTAPAPTPATILPWVLARATPSPGPSSSTQGAADHPSVLSSLRFGVHRPCSALSLQRLLVMGTLRAVPPSLQESAHCLGASGQGCSLGAESLGPGPVPGAPRQPTPATHRARGSPASALYAGSFCLWTCRTPPHRSGRIWQFLPGIRVKAGTL